MILSGCLGRLLKFQYVSGREVCDGLRVGLVRFSYVPSFAV